MDRLAFRGDSIHYVLRPGPGPTYQPNYVGDSAPTATAWSTGKRTQDGRLSQGPSSADNVPGPNTGYTTYMELARDAGKATGNVSTAEITDATPAGAELAHLPARLPGPGRHAHDLPDGGQDGGHARPRLDRRAAGRQGLRPLPRRRPRPLRAAADGRRHDERHRLRQDQGLHVRRHQGGAGRRHLARGRQEGPRPLQPEQHDDRVRAAVRPHRRVLRRQPEPRRAGPGRQRDDALPAAEPRQRAVAAGDDDQGPVAAGGRQGRLRAAGRGRLDRQARPRRRRLRPDR